MRSRLQFSGKRPNMKGKKNQYANLMTNPCQKPINSSQPLSQSKHILNHVNIDLMSKINKTNLEVRNSMNNENIEFISRIYIHRISWVYITYKLEWGFLVLINIFRMKPFV